MELVPSRGKYECWYRNCCQSSSDTCARSCRLFIMTSFLIANSGVPNAKKYMKSIKPSKVDINSFKKLQEIKENIVNFVDEGSNLYIYSPICGNGKTTWAIKIMYRYLAEVAIYNEFTRMAYFVPICSYLADLKNNEYRNSYEAIDFRNTIKELPLVIWDDIGAISLSNSDYTSLISILDERERNGKANIFTGNLDEKAMKDIMDERLFSRIWNNSIHIEFKGTDRRNTDAD